MLPRKATAETELVIYSSVASTVTGNKYNMAISIDGLVKKKKLLLSLAGLSMMHRSRLHPASDGLLLLTPRIFKIDSHSSYLYY